MAGGERGRVNWSLTSAVGGGGGAEGAGGEIGMVNWSLASAVGEGGGEGARGNIGRVDLSLPSAEGCGQICTQECCNKQTNDSNSDQLHWA